MLIVLAGANIQHILCVVCSAGSVARRHDPAGKQMLCGFDAGKHMQRVSIISPYWTNSGICNLIYELESSAPVQMSLNSYGSVVC